MLNLNNYKTIIFDCDGVILNSNFIKGNCFYLSVTDYGEAAAVEFKNYHSRAGGISRIKKFEYFINNILPKFDKEIIDKDKLKNKLIAKYESILQKNIINSETSPYLNRLKQKTNNLDWIMISGSDEKELNNIMDYKKIKNYFNLGVYGSPSTKKEIIRRELISQRIKYPALFLGDSKVDYEAAEKYNIDFIFLYGWTDLKDWKYFCESKNIFYIKNLFNLIE